LYTYAFECLNHDCRRRAIPVWGIECDRGEPYVQCNYCGARHKVGPLWTLKGDPSEFVIVGLVENQHDGRRGEDRHPAGRSNPV
jgi:hypothetical protein